MLTMFLLFTVIATIATIAPVYAIRKRLAKLFKIPYLGWIFSLAYGYGISLIMLNIFSFKSSMAGLANMAASILFSIWLYFQQEDVLSFTVKEPVSEPEPKLKSQIIPAKKHSTGFIS